MGAWIETSLQIRFRLEIIVAPRVGAWIETMERNIDMGQTIESHPVWVRGLKLIVDMPSEQIPGESHPVWVRGLKLCLQRFYQRRIVRRTPCGCVD